MHTPGPWSHEYTVNPLPGYDINGPNREPIAGICDIGGLPLEANARLIAAAPKLLEALEEAIEALGHVSVSGGPYDPDTEQRSRVYHRGRAAIAEAKGE